VTGGPSRTTSCWRSTQPSPDLRRDPVGAREEGVLEGWRIGHRALGRRDAPGVVEIAEPFLRHACDDFAGPTAGARPLLDDRDAVRLRDGGEDRRDVERAER